MLKINNPAPDFELPDQDGKIHKLLDYLGRWVLLYFYPADNTPGCTKEACGIKDYFPHFQKGDFAVLGVSADSIESHKKFAAKYKLPFVLLSDPKRKVVRSYEAGDLSTRRVSYLINPDGQIAKTYPKVKPAEHAEEVLKDLHDLISANEVTN